jgi:hypothetical protein
MEILLGISLAGQIWKDSTAGRLRLTVRPALPAG